VYESTSNLVFRGMREMIERDADIVYTPCTVLQSFDSSKPTVLSMHDIQHVHYPEFFIWPRRLSRHITYSLSARHASFFQASSEFSKQDFLRYFQCISPEQIAVIPEGVRAEEFSVPVDTDSLCEKYGLPERFLFYPAQLWLHKNHLILLQALKQIELKQGLRIPLVLTGGKYSAASRVIGYIADQSLTYVHYLGRVPFADLVGLYQKAGFLVMPSLHESNSLPVLEAAAAGTPVIASRIPPNEELARVLQLNLFDPLNQEEIERLLVRLWEDKSAGSAQSMHNRKQVGMYSWDNTAKQYLQLFERAIDT
jgi:glycosyltransferase involved in cell wall biosynthesis